MIALLTIRAIKGRKSVQLERKENAMYLPMKVGNISLNFLVDTGASTMVIFSSSYKKINDNRCCYFNKSINMIIADGTKKECPVIDFVYTNGNKTYKTEIAIMEDNGQKNYDGLVGMELLNQMKASIDVEHNLMYIE